MAKKENDEAKKAEGTPPAPDTPEAAGKKRKILILAGIGGVLTVALAGGGFFAYKTFLGGNKDDVALSAKGDPAAKENKTDSETKDNLKADSSNPNASAKTESNEKKDAKSTDSAKSEKSDKEAPKDQKAGEKSDKKSDEKSNEKSGEKADEKAGAKDDRKSQKDTREKSVGFGETHDLPRMDLNLGNPLENRFLRLSITIEYHGGEAQKEELKRREPQLKDIVITSVSSKSRLELLTEKGKERLRKELTNRFNEVLDRPVKSLFFTDFLVE